MVFKLQILLISQQLTIKPNKFLETSDQKFKNFSVQTNTMNKESQILRDFKVVRYQPNDIILVHRQSKKAYQFYDQATPNPNRIHPNVQNPLLMRPTIINKGLIYIKPPQTLEDEIDTRKRAYNRLPYSEQELIHTFRPVFECIKSIHASGVVHGNITKSSIVFVEKGQIKLKDWLVQTKQNCYYKNQNSTKIDDLKTIGLIILQAACLKQTKEVLNQNFEALLEYSYTDYSKQFLCFIISLIKGYRIAEKYIEDVINEKKISLSKNDSEVQSPEQSQIGEIEEIYKNIRKACQLRKPTPMKNSCHNLMTANQNQISPTKKFMITTSIGKKTGFKLQECENKKTLNNQDVKKKHIEKITKIIERSNAFVNQLMTRRASDATKKASSKTGTSFQGIQNSNIKKLSKEPGSVSKHDSPSKRLRAIQKKK